MNWTGQGKQEGIVKPVDSRSQGKRVEMFLHQEELGRILQTRFLPLSRVGSSMAPRFWGQSIQEVDLMSNLCELSGSDFEVEVLKSPLPTLVDFWAPWCVPCRMVGPIIEQLAAERANSVKLAKLNVDESPDVAAAYGVHSIPTLMIFKDGKVVDRFVGVQPKAVLEHALDRVAA